MPTSESSQSRTKALETAREVLRKCRASSNRYLVFLINNEPHITRDNSSITDRWERTGAPYLIGQYNKHCPVGDIAEDVEYAMVAGHG